jgi:RES domain-containing protein
VKSWRIEKQKRLSTARTGEGARITGGRWNSAGRPVVYASEHLSLAVLEILVHSPTAEQRQVARALAEVFVPDAMIATVPLVLLPPDFGYLSPLAPTQAIGDEWLDSNRSVALIVPSAVVTIESNLLLNPRHPEYAKCVWGAFAPIQLDPRRWTVPPKAP